METRVILTTDELAALGLVVAESARLESNLDTLIQGFTSLNEQQYKIIVGGSTLGRKLEILKDIGLLKLKSNSRQAQFAEIVGRITALNSERNVAVHGQWGPEGGWTLALLLKSQPRDRPGEAVQKKRNGKLIKLKATRLQELANNIAEETARLFGFWLVNRVKPAIRRSRRRLASRSSHSPGSKD